MDDEQREEKELLQVSLYVDKLGLSLSLPHPSIVAARWIVISKMFHACVRSETSSTIVMIYGAVVSTSINHTKLT
jgi:hypothetical protein